MLAERQREAQRGEGTQRNSPTVSCGALGPASVGMLPEQQHGMVWVGKFLKERSIPSLAMGRNTCP